MMMVICIKQHLSNIWSSIHEKVKQRGAWVEKKCCFFLKKKRVVTQNTSFFVYDSSLLLMCDFKFIITVSVIPNVFQREWLEIQPFRTYPFLFSKYWGIFLIVWTFTGLSALEVSRDSKMRQLLDVQPLQAVQKTVQRFEGYIMKVDFSLLFYVEPIFSQQNINLFIRNGPISKWCVIFVAS